MSKSSGLREIIEAMVIIITGAFALAYVVTGVLGFTSPWVGVVNGIVLSIVAVGWVVHR